MPHYQPVVRRDGITLAEQYLKLLCDNTFLSLWSYSGLYRDQGDKEIADLLVVFENDIIIFSDKDCAYPTTADAHVNWTRWFRTAIEKGAKQAWGAQRWVTQFPNRLFLDPKCTQQFPLDLPTRPRFHTILVTHGISNACKTHFNGGSGSLILRSDLKGFAAHTIPFTIGDLDPERTFVHIFDDTTLDIVMKTLDTIADLTQYLRDKEVLLRAHHIMAAGEEELLAAYLTTTTAEGSHVFPVPENAGAGTAFIEGSWDRFQHSPPRLAQIAHNKVSYLWDALIEKFNQHAMDADQHLVPPGGLKDSERILRFYAREPRLRRRMLSQELLEMVRITPADQRRLRIIPPAQPGDPHFVLLVFPRRDDKSPEANRGARGNFLMACLQVTKLEYPDAEDIVGFATDSGPSNQYSEDSAYFDARTWTPADMAEARDLQRRLEILKKPEFHLIAYDEYPTTGAPARKDPCPCGSGKKYKRCHGS